VDFGLVGACISSWEGLGKGGSGGTWRGMRKTFRGQNLKDRGRISCVAEYARGPLE